MNKFKVYQKIYHVPVFAWNFMDVYLTCFLHRLHGYYTVYKLLLSVVKNNTLYKYSENFRLQTENFAYNFFAHRKFFFLWS